MGKKHLCVGTVEVVAGLLNLVLVVDIAVGHIFVPGNVVDAFDALQIHGQTLKAVGQLHAHRREVNASHLLEIGELAHFHAVEPHFPAKAPGAQGGGFPVVLHKADVVLVGLDAKGCEAAEIQVLGIDGIGFQDDLELEIALQSVGVLAVAAVRRTPAGLHIGHLPGLGPKDPQEGVGVEGACPAFHTQGLLHDTALLPPVVLQGHDDVLKIHRLSSSI